MIQIIIFLALILGIFICAVLIGFWATFILLIITLILAGLITYAIKKLFGGRNGNSQVQGY